MAVKSPFAPPAWAGMRVERLGVAPATGGVPLIFSVEIAGSDQEKAVGLMFRTRLSDNEGMLFHYGREQVITMWMRNTYIPLDMLFIRANGVIHRIEARTEPLSERIISSQAPVAAVLEIAGGAAERLGIKAGDEILHPSFGTKASP
ncbi:MAG: DUF192 domain-containing protein [Hyphomicrobium sp.]